VRDRILLRVVRDAYRDAMHGGRYPVAFLFLHVDPAQVDVNVHPTKAEVRWRDPRLLHALVAPALTSALREADHAAVLPSSREERVREAVADFLEREGRPSAAAPLTSGAVAPAAPPLRVVQLHDSYLVCEVSDGIAIVDQHALHERVQYDRILRRLAEGGVTAQRLLVPEEVEVDAEARGLLEEHAGLLRRCGLEWSPFGARSIALETIPAAVPREKAAELVRDLLELLQARGASVDARTLFHDVADTMACKAAVRFGDRLSREEAEALLRESGALDRAYVCPHGRPTVLRLTFDELARRFGRR
ncbi:MAG: hypothetical protein ACREID_01635, partial [Planctomycetota bacterium]